MCITQVLIDHIIGNYSRRSGNGHHNESCFSVKYDHLTVADIHSEILEASPGPIFFTLMQFSGNCGKIIG